GYFSYLVLGAIFVLAFQYWHEQPVATVAFLAASAAVAAARLLYHFRAEGLRSRNARRWRIGFGIGVGAGIGIFAAFICYVLAVGGSHRASFFLPVSATGVTAGATNLLSGHAALIRTHLVIGITPVLVACLVVDDPLRVPVAAIVAFQLVYHLAEARRLRDETWQRLIGELVLRERQRANELLITAVAHAADAIAVVDEHGAVVHANAAFAAAREIGANPVIRDALAAGLAWRGHVHTGERHYEATVSPVGADGARRVLVARDVTESVHMREQLVVAE